MLNLLKRIRAVIFLWIALGFFLIGQLLLLISKWIITLTYYNSNYKRGLKEDFYLLFMNLKLLVAPKIASAYFAGFPYQSLEYPLMFGDRAILRRLEEYGILGSISKEHTVLDLGCAEGFIGIKISQLTGASVLNVDHSEVAVKRGLSLIRFLKLSNVQYLLCDLRSFEPQNKFDRILAMAAYATDDGGIQMTLFEYFSYLNGLLANKGLIYFESHWESHNFEKDLITAVNASGLAIQEIKWVDSGNRLFAVLKRF
jgi:SAM-dependent methyltransferase